MSANAGEDLKPIARIASGGELARIMLALKNVLAEQERVGTLVFDEVDTGVSGRAAQKVAEKLAQVSRHKQVLCVTHLPQLAAMADSHFSVEKGKARKNLRGCPAGPSAAHGGAGPSYRRQQGDGRIAAKRGRTFGRGGGLPQKAVKRGLKARRQFAGNDGSAAAEVDAVLPERPWETMQKSYKTAAVSIYENGCGCVAFYKKTFC